METHNYYGTWIIDWFCSTGYAQGDYYEGFEIFYKFICDRDQEDYDILDVAPLYGQYIDQVLVDPLVRLYLVPVNVWRFLSTLKHHFSSQER